MSGEAGVRSWLLSSWRAQARHPRLCSRGVTRSHGWPAFGVVIQSDQSIGGGKVALPALRTVRAVLPHTALQLPASSSGVSRGSMGCLSVSSSMSAKQALIHFVYQTEPTAGFDAVTSADTMRSVQIEASAHHSSRRSSPVASPPCLAISALAGIVLLLTKPLTSSFLPPFPRDGFATRPFHRSSGIGTMKALTPGGLTRTPRSPRLLRLAVPAFRPQPRDPPAGRFVSRLSANGCSRLRHT